jgi:hypothetical protein
MKNINKYNSNLLRNRSKSKWLNPYRKEFRSLFESIIPLEVIEALKDWQQNTDNESVLIGGLCLSYYERPRYTEDIDFIFLREEDIPNEVHKFTKCREHVFRHKKTGVEVETITPSVINSTKKLFQKIFKTSLLSDGVRIASPMAIVYMKINRIVVLSKANNNTKKINTDKSDIISLLQYCFENNIEQNIDFFEPNKEEIKTFNEILSDMSFGADENHYILELKNKFLKQTKSYKTKIGNYDVMIFNDGYEPRFHVGKNLNTIFTVNEDGKCNYQREYKDFIFSISLYNPIVEGHFNVRDSSTGYPNFNIFDKEEKEIMEIFAKNNLKEKFIKIWKDMD